MTLNEQITTHWKQLRGRTYDLIDILDKNDLPKKLPFETSETLYYQFWCMLGTTESFARAIEKGKWTGWNCTLNYEIRDTDLRKIKKQLNHSDELLLSAISNIDLLKEIGNGKSGLTSYLTLVEHESHHHGQLINFIYALDLEIPKSWAETWALSR